MRLLYKRTLIKNRLLFLLITIMIMVLSVCVPHILSESAEHHHDTIQWTLQYHKSFRYIKETFNQMRVFEVNIVHLLHLLIAQGVNVQFKFLIIQMILIIYFKLIALLCLFFNGGKYKGFSLMIKNS